MALNYKTLKKKLEETPLSSYELELIKDVENYIDGEILRQFDKSPYGEIAIDCSYTRFKYSPTAKAAITSLGVSRIPLMIAELEKRFIAANWVISYDLEDGMSMCGSDRMILKGSK